jgi:hypothetical protein
MASNNPATPNPFASLVITGNATVDAAIRYGLFGVLTALTGIIGGWLNAHGFQDPNINLLVTGALVSILSAGAVALWGILRTKDIDKIKEAEKLVAMNATLNLAASNKAVDTTGKVIPMGAGDGNSTPPKPITAETAPEIVKNFAPSTKT